VSIYRIALVLEHWIFFFILKGQHLGFAKNVLPPLEPKLLVMWERIVEGQKIMYSTYQCAKIWYEVLFMPI
jgi:hypothetical protein